MKPLHVFYLALLSLTILNISYKAQAQVKQTNRKQIITDPVFGVDYQEGDAHYDSVPASILPVCRIVPGRFWIYAKVQRNHHNYLIISGIPDHQDGDFFGAAVHISNGRCESEDPTWMLSGRVPVGGYSDRQISEHLPGLNLTKSCQLGTCHFMLQSREEEEILRALLQNAIERGSKAWGGELRFVT